MAVDVWSRKVVAWDVADDDSVENTADLVCRACTKKRYRRSSGFWSNQSYQQQLILMPATAMPIGRFLGSTYKLISNLIF